MAEDSPSGESPQQGGVFGNLPDSRPGSRSPRRASGKGKPAADKTAPPRAPEARAQPAQRKPPRQPADAPKPPPPAARAERAGGIEDLAWAGVAAAAEAATLGVRLASRALDALRGSSERD